MSVKKALLIGCNYASDPYNKLYGCINDVINMSNTLVDAFDYDLNNIVILRDDATNPNSLPSRKNIFNELNKLVSASANLNEIWFHYSGHGSQVLDVNGDEIDKLDEVIVPTDFKTSGFINDDTIFNILKLVSSKCRVVLLFDSCHSGSICDLAYQFQTNGTKTMSSNKMLTNPNIFCLSGCKDAQTSADSYSNFEKRAVGAFTIIFLYCLRMNHFNVDILKLYYDMCNLMLQNGFQQIPQFSCSSSNPKLVLQRNTHWDVATLKNPIPKLITRGGNSSLGKMANTLPMNMSMKKSNMNMLIRMNMQTRDKQLSTKTEFNVKV